MDNANAAAVTTETKKIAPASGKRLKRRGVSYAKWGYIFTAPFFITYAIFSLIPLVSTFYWSFFERVRPIGNFDPEIPVTYVGVKNYETVLSAGSDMFKYLGNTFVMWIIGFIPQILIALGLALIFTSYRLNIKGQSFFKTVVYMPNLIMASAFAMLFFTLFSDGGPVNLMLTQMGVIDEPIRFMVRTTTVRSLIASMNFLMWFGNTTIMLMAGIMGIDPQLFEAAEIDGAKSFTVFRKVTLPLLSPIMVYTLITSLIGGVQMFDVPQIMSNGNGGPNFTTMTLIMYLNMYMQNRTNANFGMAGAISVFIFCFTVILSGIVYAVLMKQYNKIKPAKVKKG